MKSRAAVLWGHGQDWQVEEIEIDDPGPDDVLVKTLAAGMCHSDEHVVTGDMPVPHFPFVGGHEGAGEVVAVGANVTWVEPGDHVSMSFIPSCGHCKWCSTGRQNLCDDGAKLFDLGMISDGTVRHHLEKDGTRHDVARFAQLGTFSEHLLISEHSLIKVDKDLPPELVALVSCGVATGFGSAVHRAEVQPGDVVVVVGCGGVGINAVQGARIAGAKAVVAIDPVDFKRETAEKLGATHSFTSIEAAALEIMGMTEGQGADKVIAAPGVMHGTMIEPCLNITSKGGTVVVTGVAPVVEGTVDMNLFMLAMMNKEVKGTLFGSGNPRAEIPQLLDMYRRGILNLEDLVTRRYSLNEVNQGYQDMRDGKNIRGVIVFD